MADEQAERERIIAEIRRLKDELVSLGVKPEYDNFNRLAMEDLLELRRAVIEQLRRRKLFLGEKL